MNDLLSTVDWSRGQFALTAMVHWLFVPLTIGLSLIVACLGYLLFYGLIGSKNVNTDIPVEEESELKNAL